MLPLWVMLVPALACAAYIAGVLLWVAVLFIAETIDRARPLLPRLAATADTLDRLAARVHARAQDRWNHREGH